MATLSLTSFRARLLLGLFALSTFTTAAVVPNSYGTGNQDSTIVWRSCGLNLTFPLLCGSLDVPLDYTAHDNTSTLTLKLVKAPSVQQPSRGSILINPGGPGYGGRNELVGLAPTIQNATGGHFDIVSWDPRGTGDTLTASCFSNATERALSESAPPLVADEADGSLGKSWAAAGSLASACSKALADKGTLIGTAFVARDMVRIVDSLGEDGLLRYWGFSYGTALGMTFAAMFPDKVDRVIIDGVLNPHEYYAGRDLQQVTDSDATFASFIADCQLSPDKCPLASYAQGKNQSLYQIIEKLMEDIKRVPFSLETKNSSLQLDYGLLKSLEFGLIKAGPSSWPGLASFLRSILDGDRPAVLSFIQSILDAESAEGPFPGPLLAEAISAIRCSDSALRADNLTDLLPLFHGFYERSKFAGDILIADQVKACARWPFRAKEVYSGGFNNIVTRHPLMFIGNSFDPITPLVSARNASAAFLGS